MTNPPITPAQTDELAPAPRDWRTVMRNLIREHDKHICLHEETHRGGTNWTICEQCGGRWADDRGGFKAYEEPAAVTEAWALLAEPEAPAQTDAPAKLAEIPASRSEERERWSQMIEQQARHEWPNASTDPLIWTLSEKAILTLMSEARKQGRKDVLGSSASPSGHSRAEPSGLGPTAECPSRGARHPWCQPGDDPKRRFVVQFDDPDQGCAVFDNEDEARRYYERATLNWNCYLLATLPRESSPAFAAAIPSGWRPALEPCSKEEIAAWEAWATGRGYDMHEHPLHYLFMDTKTDMARQGWKAGLAWAHEQVAASCDEHPQGEDPQGAESRSDASAVGRQSETPQPLPQSTPSQPEMTVEEAREVVKELEPLDGPPSNQVQRMKDHASIWEYAGAHAEAQKWRAKASRIELALRILSSSPAAVLRKPGNGGRS